MRANSASLAWAKFWDGDSSSVIPPGSCSTALADPPSKSIRSADSKTPTTARKWAVSPAGPKPDVARDTPRGYHFQWSSVWRGSGSARMPAQSEVELTGQEQAPGLNTDESPSRLPETMRDLTESPALDSTLRH